MISEISAAVVCLNSGTVSRSHVEAAIAKPLPIELLPEELYLLASLSKHLERQQWVAEIVKSHLKIDTAELGSKGLWSLPDSFPRKGTVTAEPAWTYYFHGKGCCLTHSDGTKIDVDFSADGSVSLIDRFFYSNYLKSATNRPWYEPKQESREYLAEAWRFDLEGLKQKYLVCELDTTDSLQLTEAGQECVQPLRPLLDAISDASPLGKIFGYALVKDWDKALTEANNSGHVFEPLRQLVGESQAQRLISLRSRVASDKGLGGSYAMAAMGAFPAKKISVDVLSAIAGVPASALNLAALDVFYLWGNGDAKSYVFSMLEEHSQAVWADTQSTESWDYWAHADGVKLVLSLIRWLLEHERREKLSDDEGVFLCSMLENDFGVLEAKAGSLLYLFDTKRGLIKLGAGLCNPVPLVRNESAVYLAIIDTELSIKVLQQGGEYARKIGYQEPAFGLVLLGNEKIEDVFRRIISECEASEIELDFEWQCMKHYFTSKQAAYKVLLEKWNSRSVC